MDINKRFDRILQIFFLLQSKSVVTSDELKNRFETSLRTIYRDLKALENAGVPIVNEAGVGYSIMEGYRLQPSRFNQEEILSLMIAEKMMQKHETQFVKQHFEAAMIKIKSSFRVHQKDDLYHLDDKIHFNDQTKSTEYLPNVIDVLLNSTLKQKRANITYLKSGDTETILRQVEPVGVYYENFFWYVLAYCHLRKEYRSFRLDRIKKISLSDEPFTKKHPSINELRNKNCSENVTKITIKVDRRFAHFLFWERQSFGFKEETVCGEDMLMQFDCEIHPTSFVRWFMKFVDVGEILEPANLQPQLIAIMTAGLERATTKNVV